MNEEAIAQIERMFREGKISADDKKRLEEALGYNDKNESLITKIEISGFKSEDINIVGDENITMPVIEQGSDIINIENHNGIVKITSRPDINKIGFLGWAVNGGDEKISLRVPKNIEEAMIRLVSGDIEVSGITGKLNISVVSGDIEINDFKGIANISSISGDLKLKEIESTVDLNTKSGDISVRDSKLEGTIKAYSGDISIENCSLSKTKISVFSGDVEAIKTKLNDATDISTSFGDVDIEIDPKEVSIVAITSSGDISDGGIKQVRENGLTRIGEGAVLVNIKTRSGDINIRRVL
jgi:hypothetical protein